MGVGDRGRLSVTKEKKKLGLSSFSSKASHQLMHRIINDFDSAMRINKEAWDN